jgi:hypothetical protein
MMWWMTPQEKARKQEFVDAWRQRHTTEPPMGTFKSWYRQWVQTKIPAGDWLDANTAGSAAPPGAPGGTGGAIPGGTPGGAQV